MDTRKINLKNILGSKNLLNNSNLIPKKRDSDNDSEKFSNDS